MSLSPPEYIRYILDEINFILRTFPTIFPMSARAFSEASLCLSRAVSLDLWVGA